MFGNSREIRRINELKLRSGVRRAQLMTSVQFFRPLLKTTAKVGIYALAIKHMAPTLKRIALGLVQHKIAKRGQPRLFTLVGLVSAGIGIARRISSRESKNEEAALE